MANECVIGESKNDIVVLPSLLKYIAVAWKRRFNNLNITSTWYVFSQSHASVNQSTNLKNTENQNQICPYPACQ